MTNWKQDSKMDSFKQKRNVSDMPKNFPQTIPVFPLYGCILLPKTILPLNIFEPRYRQMVEHAMESEEMIGMIQPLRKLMKIFIKLAVWEKLIIARNKGRKLPKPFAGRNPLRNP
ncbi:MAG: hypothetical protein Ct9H90mP8_1850 [Pseudomonadota bacterium]|nr:MAG: hypothetical protein Ct9H90mP8_1850 [Pseudomonadota bacterium]